MESKPVIEAKNITVRYGNLTVLENVSFKVNKGEIFSIVGGSGCGKSTLLRQLIGLEIPTEGTVYIDGDDFTNSYGKQRNRILRKFGVMFQSSGLFASMTLAENIALPLATYTGMSEARIVEMIDLKLRAVGLGGFESYLPSEISGGMKKRAALARAMALDPLILVFDEPSSGLDPLTSANLDKLIVELNNALGTTMIVVTHDLASCLTISHKILMLDKSVKGVLFEGTPELVRNYRKNPYVYNFFNRIAE
jgi:phospholipid/cholesterol/gamma-HCH transport system ATP-binding protein